FAFILLAIDEHRFQPSDFNVAIPPLLNLSAPTNVTRITLNRGGNQIPKRQTTPIDRRQAHDRHFHMNIVIRGLTIVKVNGVFAGFPGFLATRLVRRLATEGARFILLTLPQFTGLAQLEAGQIAAETGAEANNFRIIEGDITKPDLGLSTNELERARRETTTIFHLAAVYDLAVDSAVAAHVNVEGSLNINNF